MKKNTQPVEKSDHQPDGSLQVHSIWDTIQGEGPFAGTPATFVRLAGCNLICEWCFGISTKSRIPYLSQSIGPKIRLDKIEIGSKILTFDTDFLLVETEVINLIERDVNTWLEIIIDEAIYDVTPEHPFFTKRGLLSAYELNIGDIILEAKPSEIISFKKTGDRNPMKDPNVSKRSTENTNYIDVGRKISKTRLQKFATGELTAYNPTDEHREKMSESMKGSKNPNWNGGPPPNLTVKRKQLKTAKCERCGHNGKLLVHHRDHNSNNDEIDNLEILCHPCHNSEHQRGYNFWNGKRRDGKELVNKHNGKTVKKITRQSGKLRVRNISCSPYNTYLADGMWVHNCDTDYTSNRTNLSVQSLLDDILLLPDRNLVIFTGGEPLRQNIGPVIREITNTGRTVQIETNGTYPPVLLPWTNPLFAIVCSPKTPKLHSDIHTFISAFKYIVKHGSIDSDGLPLSTVGPQYGRPARPDKDWKGDIYIQPLDEQHEEKNKLNMEAAVQSCMEHSYKLCLQMHKIAGLE